MPLASFAASIAMCMSKLLLRSNQAGSASVGESKKAM
jgi:hypothetical protein